MKWYRVFVFEMGHVNAVVELEAADDDAAVQEAKNHFPTEERELWQEQRMVARLAREL